MNDDQIEATLRRYRIADPSADVRGRVLAGNGHPATVELTAWDWAIVSAAALLVAVSLATEPRPDKVVSGAEAAWMAEVEAMAGLLGGGPAATSIVEMAIPRPSAFELEPEEE